MVGTCSTHGVISNKYSILFNKLEEKIPFEKLRLT